MKKILTILVPVYNTEKYIRRCLDSVLLKSVLNDIEVLVVSDGSKDSSNSIVEEYVRRFPKTVRLIEKENGGHGSTINKGIELSQGKYFKVLDSDDWFNCFDFQEFVQRLKTEDADLVVTNYRQEHVYSQISIFNSYKDLKDREILNFDQMDLKRLNGEYFVMATSTYKLEVLKNAKVNLLEKTFYVDMQYNIQPIKEVKTITYYDLDVYRYYIGRKEQSVNVSSFVKNQDSHEKVMRYLLEYYENIKNELSANKIEYVEMILLYMLNTHYTIYCIYDNNHARSYRKIKKFDDYFKNLNYDLYQKLNKMTYIRFYRKFNFVFVRFFPKLYKKSFNFLARVKAKLRGK